LKSESKIKDETKQEEESKEKSQKKTQPLIKVKSNQNLKTFADVKPDQKTQQKELQKVKQDLKIGTELKFDVGVKINKTPNIKQGQTQTPVPPIIKPPITPPPTIKESFSPSSKSSAKERLQGLFKVFARKGGEDIQVGQARTSRQAFSLLRRKLKGGLRASGFVTKGSQKIKPLAFGEFRLSKKDPYRLVQKKTARFGTKQETSEAQFFRKAKGGNFFGSKKKSQKFNFI